MTIIAGTRVCGSPKPSPDQKPRVSGNEGGQAGLCGGFRPPLWLHDLHLPLSHLCLCSSHWDWLVLPYWAGPRSVHSSRPPLMGTPSPCLPGTSSCKRVTLFRPTPTPSKRPHPDQVQEHRPMSCHLLDGDLGQAQGTSLGNVKKHPHCVTTGPHLDLSGPWPCPCKKPQHQPR